MKKAFVAIALILSCMFLLSSCVETAVAIPLYGAINKNANNKTCSSNIKSIKSNSANFYVTYDRPVENLEELASMFDDDEIPTCPLGGEYLIEIKEDGMAVVECPNCDSNHTPDGSGYVDYPLGHH